MKRLLSQIAWLPDTIFGNGPYAATRRPSRVRYVPSPELEKIADLEAENAKLRAVANVASELNRLLNEWDLVRNHSYIHEQLSKALAALETTNG